MSLKRTMYAFLSGFRLRHAAERFFCHPAAGPRVRGAHDDKRALYAPARFSGKSSANSSESSRSDSQTAFEDITPVMSSSHQLAHKAVTHERAEPWGRL